MRIQETSRRWNKAGTLLLASVLVGGVFAAQLPAQQRAAASDVPRYKVDPSWPKDLPNNWILATITGMVVDKDDHIWAMHRPRQVAGSDAGAMTDPPTYECCIAAPSIIQFDAQGNVLKSWGGPNYVPHWPTLEHGLFIDRAGNFWIGGTFVVGVSERLLSAPIPKPKELLGDRQVLKFSPDGKQLLEIGHPSNAPVNNADTSILGGAAEITVDDDAQEVYIADGYLNQRIVVYDSKTGAFKRGWGAYGMPLSQIENRPAGGGENRPPLHNPNKPAAQFRGDMLAVKISKDGMVYVADRGDDRIQIFTKQGKFVKEFLVHPKTMGWGSVWGVTISRDPQEKYLYVSDAYNGKVWILNREDGKELGSIGSKGKNPGQFNGVEYTAFDSKGNLYTAEVSNNFRIQKFVPVK